MRSLHDAKLKLTFSRMFAPIRLLRVQALGTELAFDAASLCDVLALAPGHAPVRFGRGLAMSYEGRIVPLVDFRSPAGKEGAMMGSCVVVANVQHSRFAMLVDCMGEYVHVDYAAIRPPEPALAERCPYLEGCISCAGTEVYLVDLERLLGPAIRTHLHGGG